MEWTWGLVARCESCKTDDKDAGIRTSHRYSRVPVGGRAVVATVTIGSRMSKL